MHIAILVTNTDRTDFARRHPRDPEMFRNLIDPLRPDWRFSAFDVTDNDFPGSFSGFNGVILTGSPASVRDSAPWISHLMLSVREIEQQRIPMFGACFGHQAIAQALGGAVGHNPGGWQLGHTVVRYSKDRPWLAGGGRIGLYAAHKEQVLTAPEGADVLASSADCPISAMAIADHVFTTQHHPEMTHEFIAALIDEMSGNVSSDIENKARISLENRTESMRFAGWLVAFFEQAAGIRTSACNAASD